MRYSSKLIVVFILIFFFVAGFSGTGSPFCGGNALPGPKVKSIGEGLNQGMEYDKPGEVSKGGEGEKKEKGNKEKKEKEPKTKIGKQWKDLRENPENWEMEGRRKDPKGDSWREIWRNKNTGEKIGVHQKAPDSKGRHPHPFSFK